MKDSYFIKVASITVLTCLAVSCKKDDVKALVCYPISIGANGSSAAITITYNDKNQPTQLVSNGVTLDFTYDSNGNATAASVTGPIFGSYVLTYDADNKLVTSVLTRDAITTTVTYSYNSFGQLILIDYGGGYTHSLTYPNSITRNYDKSVLIYNTGGCSYPSTYEYDNKINPKNRFPSQALIIDLVPATGNNVTKVTTTSVSGSTCTALGTIFTSVTTYEYNENGYPTVGTNTITRGGSQTTSVSDISYTCK